MHSRRDGSPTIVGWPRAVSGWRPEEQRADRRAPRDLWNSRALCRIGVIDAAAGRAVPAIRSYESARRDYLLESFRLAGKSCAGTDSTASSSRRNDPRPSPSVRPGSPCRLWARPAWPSRQQISVISAYRHLGPPLRRGQSRPSPQWLPHCWRYQPSSDCRRVLTVSLTSCPQYSVGRYQIGGDDLHPTLSARAAAGDQDST